MESNGAIEKTIRMRHAGGSLLIGLVNMPLGEFEHYQCELGRVLQDWNSKFKRERDDTGYYRFDPEHYYRMCGYAGIGPWNLITLTLVSEQGLARHLAYVGNVEGQNFIHAHDAALILPDISTNSNNPSNAENSFDDIRKMLEDFRLGYFLEVDDFSSRFPPSSTPRVPIELFHEKTTKNEGRDPKTYDENKQTKEPISESGFLKNEDENLGQGKERPYHKFLKGYVWDEKYKKCLFAWLSHVQLKEIFSGHFINDTGEKNHEKLYQEIREELNGPTAKSYKESEQEEHLLVLHQIKFNYMLHIEDPQNFGTWVYLTILDHIHEEWKTLNKDHQQPSVFYPLFTDGFYDIVLLIRSPYLRVMERLMATIRSLKMCDLMDTLNKYGLAAKKGLKNSSESLFHLTYSYVGLPLGKVEKTKKIFQEYEEKHCHYYWGDHTKYKIDEILNIGASRVNTKKLQEKTQSTLWNKSDLSKVVDETLQQKSSLKNNEKEELIKKILAGYQKNYEFCYQKSIEEELYDLFKVYNHPDKLKPHENREIYRIIPSTLISVNVGKVEDTKNVLNQWTRILSHAIPLRGKNENFVPLPIVYGRYDFEIYYPNEKKEYYVGDFLLANELAKRMLLGSESYDQSQGSKPPSLEIRRIRTPLLEMITRLIFPASYYKEYVQHSKHDRILKVLKQNLNANEYNQIISEFEKEWRHGKDFLQFLQENENLSSIRWKCLKVLNKKHIQLHTPSLEDPRHFEYPSKLRLLDFGFLYGLFESVKKSYEDRKKNVNHSESKSSKELSEIISEKISEIFNENQNFFSDRRTSSQYSHHHFYSYLIMRFGDEVSHETLETVFTSLCAYDALLTDPFTTHFFLDIFESVEEFLRKLFTITTVPPSSKDKDIKLVYWDIHRKQKKEFIPIKYNQTLIGLEAWMLNFIHVLQTAIGQRQTGIHPHHDKSQNRLSDLRIHHLKKIIGASWLLKDLSKETIHFLSKRFKDKPGWESHAYISPILPYFSNSAEVLFDQMSIAVNSRYLTSIESMIMIMHEFGHAVSDIFKANNTVGNQSESNKNTTSNGVFAESEKYEFIKKRILFEDNRLLLRNNDSILESKINRYEPGNIIRKMGANFYSKINNAINNAESLRELEEKINEIPIEEFIIDGFINSAESSREKLEEKINKMKDSSLEKISDGITEFNPNMVSFFLPKPNIWDEIASDLFMFKTCFAKVIKDLNVDNKVCIYLKDLDVAETYVFSWLFQVMRLPKILRYGSAKHLMIRLVLQLGIIKYFYPNVKTDKPQEPSDIWQQIDQCLKEKLLPFLKKLEGKDWEGKESEQERLIRKNLLFIKMMKQQEFKETDDEKDPEFDPDLFDFMHEDLPDIFEIYFKRYQRGRAEEDPFFDYLDFLASPNSGPIDSIFFQDGRLQEGTPSENPQVEATEFEQCRLRIPQDIFYLREGILPEEWYGKDSKQLFSYALQVLGWINLFFLDKVYRRKDPDYDPQNKYFLFGIEGYIAHNHLRDQLSLSRARRVVTTLLWEGALKAIGKDLKGKAANEQQAGAPTA